MNIDLQFVDNSLSTFVYEPFSFTISNIGPYTLTTSTSSGIPPGYLANYNTEVIFSSSSNAMGVGSESFTITAKDGNGTTVATSSNIVTVGAGRFLDAGGNSYLGSNFAFYKNEPITPITLVAPFAISVPTSVPTLPPGLAYTSNASNTYTISGTPLVTVPQSNYLVIGKGSGSNLGKIVTSQFGLSVSNERILMNLEGSPIVSQMTVGTPIPPRTITSAFPPYPYGGTLRYTWSGVPDGISVTNSGGVPQSSPFTPLDLSSTLIIQGAPSLAAANAYRNADIESNVVTFMATRTNPLPQISNSIPITFAFGETVLFDPLPVPFPTLYSGVALNPTAISFRAQTYFGSGSAIANISATSLPPGLSLNFVGDGRAYLIGTPTTVGSASYTITAVNSTSPTPVSRSLSVPITVTTDTVTFEPPTPNPADAPSNFVLSRPISSALPGYYTSNIQFKATAASGNAVTFSTSSFAGTGLSLSNVGSNTVQLVGTPESVTSLATATITASVVGTPATASTTFKFEILNDDISFSQPSALQLSFIQNRAITPIQLSATTLSERPVISFTSSNMPSGLSLSTTGIISGTPLSSSVTPFDVTGSTGYMSDSEPYTYTLTPDSIILIERPNPSYALTLGGAIPAATVSGLSYSGTAVSNFVFTSLPITYGLTIGNATGVFGGTLTTSLPPDVVLPSNVNFSVQGSAGLLTASIPVELNTSNAPQYEWFVLKSASIGKTRTTLNNWSELKPASETIYIASYTDCSIRPIDVSTRTIVAVSERTGTSYSSNGTTFVDYDIPGTPWPFDNPSAGFGPMTGFLNMGPKFITRVGNTTTLYGTSYDWQFTNIGAFWKSLDDGLTWTVDFPLLANGVTGRSWLPNAVSYGNAIAYKDGVLLIGGNGAVPTDPPIIRSTDLGDVWNAVAGSIEAWVTFFCVDASRWIAAGSDGYAPGSVYSTAARTLRYSDDQGANWALVTSGDFNYISDIVVYGNGVWVAGGRHYRSVDGYIYYEFRTSTDGLVWTSFTLPAAKWWPSTPIFDGGEDAEVSTLLDSILYDGESFIVLIRQTNDNGSSTTYSPFAYSHAADGSSLSSGWTEVSMTTMTSAPVGNPFSPSLFLKGRYPIALEPPTPVLNFPSQAGNGPTVTSPTNTSLLLYQYAPMTPITFSATGTGTVYFFVRDAELPRGITFNSVTNTLSGTPMLIGTSATTIYVKDDDGVTLLTLQFRVIIPSIERQQTSAGAWTSLIRQYTVVNAAQNSSNGKTLPATDPPLGEFMRPPPPDSVNVLPCPKC